MSMYSVAPNPRVEGRIEHRAMIFVSNKVATFINHKDTKFRERKQSNVGGNLTLKREIRTFGQR